MFFCFKSFFIRATQQKSCQTAIRLATFFYSLIFFVQRVYLRTFRMATEPLLWIVF